MSQNSDLKKPILEIKNLSVKFSKKNKLFKDLNLTIYENERVSIIGSNGAGKSTLIKAILGLVPSEYEKIVFFEEELDKKQTKKRKRILNNIGMVHQKHNLMDNGTALTNVIHGSLGRVTPRFLCWNQAFTPQNIREEAMYYLEQVGLADKALHKIKELSGGQSQRVAIARALMQKPKLIIADEPVASLDPKSGEKVMKLFSRLASENGISLLFISHHLSHAIDYSDRILGIKNKKIELDLKSKKVTIDELEEIYGS